LLVVRSDRRIWLNPRRGPMTFRRPNVALPITVSAYDSNIRRPTTYVASSMLAPGASSSAAMCSDLIHDSYG